jgi:small-conductance mechanosensitive channel
LFTQEPTLIRPNLAAALVCLTLLNAAPAHAFLGNFGRAMGDVFSAGQTGRDRDEQWRREQEQKAQQDRANNEQLRQQKIQQLRQQVLAVTDNIRDLEYFTTNLDSLLDTTSDLSITAQNELGRRTKLRGATLPRLKNLIGADADYSRDVLAMMEELAIAANSSPDQADKVEDGRASLARTRGALRRLRETAQNHKVAMVLIIQDGPGTDRLKRKDPGDARPCIDPRGRKKETARFA